MNGDAGPRLTDVYAPSKDVVARKVADEYVLVPLARRGADLDSIFNLTGVGAFVWQSLDGRRDGRAIVAAIVAAYEVDEGTAAQDYREFVAQLLSIGAVVRSAG